MNNIKSIAIVGCGAVGKAIYNDLHKQGKYELSIFNSITIKRAFMKSFDLLIYAGVPGVKWKANKEPEKDMGAIEIAEKQFKEIKANHKILISTIDADNKDAGCYGAHRNILEQKVLASDVAVVRLPALVGKTIVKNQWYDIHHPLPRVMNRDISAKLNTAIDLITNRIDIYIENDRPDNVVTYHPSKYEFKKFNLGMHLAANPYSKMLWLDIDNLGTLLLNQFLVEYGQINLFASEFKGEPALLEIQEMYKATTHTKLPKIEKSQSNQYPFPKIDHSKHVDNATFVNSVVFRKGDDF